MGQHSRSIELFESLGLDPRQKDDLFLHALEVLGAISCITECGHNNTDIDMIKLRIFWKSIQEIATQNLDDTRKKDSDVVKTRSAVKMVLTAFPDQKKRIDGRMWLPMHFAVSVPNVELEDIRHLFEDERKAIVTFSTMDLPYGPRGLSVAPCHLAVMINNPNMDLIELLKSDDQNFAKVLASNGSTPLHLAAEFSDSVTLIQQLVQLNPMALEMHNSKGETPLCRVARNSSHQAPQLLRALIDAAPQTVRLARNGKLPLHRFLHIEDASVDPAITKELVLILLEAFPDAAQVSDFNGQWPIYIAAQYCSVDILRIITEANLEILSTTNATTIGSVAHCAVLSGRLENIRYIHSKMPELFYTLNERHQTPLHLATERFEPDLIKEMVSLVPETARIVDVNGNNLLHILLSKVRDGHQVNNLIRHLLRLIPGGALAINKKRQTPYDLLHSRIEPQALARRLRLLAGAPSLHPKKRQQMNYQARKGALFAFFAPRGGEHHSGGEGLDICHRIRLGVGAMEIIRQVVSFL